MDTNQILTLTVFVVVITIVGTIALAAVGYFAFRLRERKNPTSPGLDETMSRPYFFERLTLPSPQLAHTESEETKAVPAEGDRNPALGPAGPGD